MQTKKVSIVIPVYNAEKTLTLCLDSLMNLDYPKQDLEIIVVDNGSTDNTKELIVSYPVNYVYEPKVKQYSAALNRGIQISQGEFIAFTHGDCVVERFWISNLLSGFKDEQIAGCGGKILPYRLDTPAQRYIASRTLDSQLQNICSKERILPYILNANAIYRRSVLEQIGFFDEYFSEDMELDLCWRIFLAGYIFNYTKAAVVYHRYRESISLLWKQLFNIAVNDPRFFKKYDGIISPFYSMFYREPLSLLNRICVSIKGFLKFLIRPQSNNSYPSLYYLLDIISAFAFFIGGLYGVYLNQRLRKSPLPLRKVKKIVYRDFDDEIVVINTFTKSYFYLNDVSAQIWRKLNSGNRPVEVMDYLIEEYGISKEQASQDVDEYLYELAQAGLLNEEDSLVENKSAIERQ
ncbi:MAG: PqqD family peptide modification chaperone [Candidatus Omnitrophota bacterium]|nr:PqqD family peptide modification chaperone [Candidatus Omnitrophota bacterium]